MALTEKAISPQVSMLSVLSLVSEDETRLSRDETHIESLVADFRQRMRENPDENPIHTPLRVYRRADKNVIKAGNYRFRAALMAGLLEVPCIIEDAPADAAQGLIEYVKDNELHHPYTPLERARNILRLVELKGCTQGEAARLLGITESDGAKAVSVLKKFPADLHGLIGEGEGKIPFTCAYLLSRVPDEAKVRELADRFVKGLMTRDRLEPVVATLLGKNPKKEKPVKVTLAGVTMMISLTDLAKLKTTLAAIVTTLAKLEKEGLPLCVLPQMLRQ